MVRMESVSSDLLKFLLPIIIKKAYYGDKWGFSRNKFFLADALGHGTRSITITSDYPLYRVAANFKFNPFVFAIAISLWLYVRRAG